MLIFIEKKYASYTGKYGILIVTVFWKMFVYCKEKLCA